MLNDDIKIKLLKIYALSISGIAGEKETAAKLLDSLLKKHEVSLDDVLNSDKPIVGRLYDYSNQYELHLMIQLLDAKFYERHSFYIVFEHQQLSVSLSESDHIIFDFLFGVYQRALEKELKKTVKNFDLRVERNSQKLEEVKKQYEKLKAKYLQLAELKYDDMMTTFTAFVCKNELFAPKRDSSERKVNSDIPKRFFSKYKNMKVVPIYDSITARNNHEN